MLPKDQAPEVSQYIIYQASSISAFADMQMAEKQSINRRQLEAAANVTLMTSDPVFPIRPNNP